MNKNSIVITSIFLLLLSSCATVQKAAYYFIFIDDGQPGVKVLQNTLAPLIDTIIQQELGVSEAEKFPRFRIKQRPSLTLAYVAGYQEKEEGLMLKTLDAVEKAQKFCAPTKATMTSQADFFGARQEELVVLVDDPDHALYKLNEQIRTALREADTTYQKIHHTNLYDIQYSEHYPYTPHISLGRLQFGSLKHHAQEVSQDGDALIARIKLRIEQEVFPVIATLLTPENKKIVATSFCVYNGHEKERIKRYALSPRARNFLCYDLTENAILFCHTFLSS